MIATPARSCARRAIGAWLALGLGLLCLLTAGGSMTTTDAVVAYEVTRSIVERGAVDTGGDLIGNDAYRGPDGRYFSPFGIAQSVWNVPSTVRLFVTPNLTSMPASASGSFWTGGRPSRSVVNRDNP